MIKLSSSATSLYRNIMPWLSLIMALLVVSLAYFLGNLPFVMVAAIFSGLSVINIFFVQPTRKLHFVYYDDEKKQFKVIDGKKEPVLLSIERLTKVRRRLFSRYCCLFFSDHGKVWFMLPLADDPERKQVIRLLNNLRETYVARNQAA